MIKKLGLISGVAAVLLMLGCSNKQPNLENAQLETNQTQQKVVQNEQNATTTQQTQKNEVNESVQQEKIKLAQEIKQKQENEKQFAQNVANIVVYFDFDKYNIRQDQWPKVQKLADLIKSHPGKYTIRIEGNCDEWGTEEYNYGLGIRRANSVKNALIKLGVDPNQLTIISYGELNPVCTAHAKWCWAKNRRDNFTYLP
jgi:peptidoglycan-associated lipoprotein